MKPHQKQNHPYFNLMYQGFGPKDNIDNNEDNDKELKTKINELERELKSKQHEIKELNLKNSQNESELESIRKDKKYNKKQIEESKLIIGQLENEIKQYKEKE